MEGCRGLPALTCGEMERAGLPASRVPAVDVLRPHEPLHALHVAVPAGFEELAGWLRHASPTVAP